MAILDMISFLNINEDSSNNESDDVAVEESSTLCHVQNKETHSRFLFCCSQNKKRTDDRDICKCQCKCIRNWPLPIGAFQDQCKQTMINKHN